MLDLWDKIGHKVYIPFVNSGRVAEWLKAPVLKTGEGATPPWVRIPPLPPFLLLFSCPYLDSFPDSEEDSSSSFLITNS